MAKYGRNKTQTRMIRPYNFSATLTVFSKTANKKTRSNVYDRMMDHLFSIFHGDVLNKNFIRFRISRNTKDQFSRSIVIPSQ